MQRIRVIDLETGPEPDETSPGIIEFGWCDVIALRQDLLGSPIDWQVQIGGQVLVNPLRPIPPETSAIHNLIDEDVAGSPTWDQVAFQVKDKPLAYAAHGAEHERKVLPAEFYGETPFICTYKIALHLWPDAMSHSNGGVRYFIKPEGLDRAKALPVHRALPDAYVTAFTLREALNAGNSVETLIKWSNEPALLPRCKIGKWRNDGKGTPWEDVDSGFLNWMLDKDFDENSLHTARHHLEQREIDQRLEQERRDMDRQYQQNGFNNPLQEPPKQELPPLSAYQEPLL